MHTSRVAAALLSAACLFALPAAARAAVPDDEVEFEEPELRIGDKAPRLSGLDWLRGDAVRSFKRGRIYVIDFWSNAGRNRWSLRRVGELAARHGDDVEVISVAVPLGDPNTDWVPEIVEWVGDAHQASVAVDTDQRCVQAYRAGADDRPDKELEYSLRVAGAHAQFESWRLSCYSLARAEKRYAEARAQAQAYLEGPWGQWPFDLLELASTIAWETRFGDGASRDLDLARVAAERAVALDGRFDPDPLMILARVHAAERDWEPAVAVMQEAIGRAPPSEVGALERGLEEFHEQARIDERLAEPEPDADGD